MLYSSLWYLHWVDDTFVFHLRKQANYIIAIASHHWCKDPIKDSQLDILGFAMTGDKCKVLSFFLLFL